MRQQHKAGDKGFVDYAGMTMPVHDQKTGEITQHSIFVYALSVSNYTYAEAQECADMGRHGSAAPSEQWDWVKVTLQGREMRFRPLPHRRNLVP